MEPRPVLNYTRPGGKTPRRWGLTLGIFVVAIGLVTIVLLVKRDARMREAQEEGAARIHRNQQIVDEATRAAEDGTKSLDELREKNAAESARHIRETRLETMALDRPLTPDEQIELRMLKEKRIKEEINR